jgi:hypothetical protein
VVLCEPKQSSALIPYSSREILESIESGLVPSLIKDWLTIDQNNRQLIRCAILEKNNQGETISTRLVNLKNKSCGNESSEIMGETSQLYRWSSRDRLILDSCLSMSTSEPLCLNPSPAVHIIQNLTQNRIRTNSSHMQRGPIFSETTLPLVQTTQSNHQNSSHCTFSSGIQVPIFPTRSYLVGTVREAQLVTPTQSQLIGSNHQLITIRLTSQTGGSYEGVVIHNDTAESYINRHNESNRAVPNQYFHPSTPREAEAYLKQFIELYINNDTSNSTLTLVRDGTVFYDSRQDASGIFPSTLFPELESGLVDRPAPAPPEIH